MHIGMRYHNVTSKFDYKFAVILSRVFVKCNRTTCTFTYKIQCTFVKVHVKIECPKNTRNEKKCYFLLYSIELFMKKTGF